MAHVPGNRTIAGTGGWSKYGRMVEFIPPGAGKEEQTTHGVPHDLHGLEHLAGAQQACLRGESCSAIKSSCSNQGGSAHPKPNMWRRRAHSCFIMLDSNLVMSIMSLFVSYVIQLL